MRLNPEDEHVSVHGRFVHQKSTTGQMLLKTWSGDFSHMDLWNLNDHHGLHRHDNNDDETEEGRLQLPYPRLPVSRLNKCLEEHHNQWRVESIRISHVQLLGSRNEFEQLASYLTQCQTLKTVLLSDCKTSRSMTTRDDASGFDTILEALSKTPQLQDVSLQNMSMSGDALGVLCRSATLTKLQVLQSQSHLPTGCITGKMVRSMAYQLTTPSTSSLSNLRIFGVLDYEACRYLSEMLLVNRTLQKLSFRIKLQPSTTTSATAITPATADQTSNAHDDEMPLLAALRSPSCCLSNLELYLSGARPDIDCYAKSFCKALQSNTSLQHLNIILFGLESAASLFHLGGGTRGSLMSGGRNNSIIATLHTNSVWMEQLEGLLRQGNNYVLQQVLMNHGMLDMSDAIKMYLRLNRAGRGELLRSRTCSTASSSDENNNHNQGMEGLSLEQSVVAARSDTVVAQDEISNSTRETTRAVRASEIEAWIDTLDRVKTDVSSIYYLLACNPTLFCGHFLFGERQGDMYAGSGHLPLKRKR